MKNVRPGKMQLLVFVASLGYLCVGHVYRLIYDYGGYTLDITGYVINSSFIILFDIPVTL